MSRAVSLSATIFTVLLTTIALGGLYSIAVSSIHAPRAIPLAIVPVTEQELAVSLHRVGLSAESLAACGVTPQSCDTIVGNGEEHLAEHIQQLRDADANLMQAKVAHDKLKRLVNSGLADEGQKQSFVEAQTALAAADASVQSRLAAFKQAAMEGLAGDIAARLAMITSHARWLAPIQYKVVERSESDWIMLRDCLAHKRISEEYGDDMHPDAVAFLQQCDADPTVSAAKTSTDLNLDAVTAAWNNAVYPGE